MSQRAHDKRPALYLAEFSSPESCLKAAERVRDEGYEHWDVHTPYPVHGMDSAMGMSDSPLGWIVLIFGLTGVTGAVLMMWWMNAVDYPLIIGGKPAFAPPSMVPIMFELTVLLSAFGAVLGMFHLNRLPRHHHPVFYSERFGQFSNDRFFISIEAEDRQFDVDKTKAFLESLGPDGVELVREEDD